MTKYAKLSTAGKFRPEEKPDAEGEAVGATRRYCTAPCWRSNWAFLGLRTTRAMATAARRAMKVRSRKSQQQQPLREASDEEEGVEMGGPR